MNMKMKTALASVGILLLVCAAEAAQLVNPAFNEDLKGWSKGLPGWSVETGAGLNGSKGLVFRSETPVTPKWMLQSVTLKPGARYRFGCWTKVNPVSPHAVAQFALEWHDKDGKWLGGGYMTCHKTGDVWRKVEQVTKEIPAAAAKAHLLVFFDPRRDGGIAGEFAFDDFFLEEADLMPLAAVTSGAYRDEVNGPGEVKLLGATDVVGVDPYPVGNCQKLSAVTDFCRAARAHTCGVKAMWNVPQAFDWGNYRKKQTDPHRMPTKDELRNMNWQHLANGANGLISYSFFDVRRQTNAEADWQTVREVAWEIDRYVPVILSEPGPAATAPKDISVRTWRKDGEVWVLAVNPNETDVACEVAVPRVSGPVVRELGDGAPTPCGDGRFAYRLGRYAVSLVRFAIPRS